MNFTRIAVRALGLIVSILVLLAATRFVPVPTENVPSFDAVSASLEALALRECPTNCEMGGCPSGEHENRAGGGLAQGEIHRYTKLNAARELPVAELEFESRPQSIDTAPRLGRRVAQVAVSRNGMASTEGAPQRERPTRPQRAQEGLRD